MEAMVYRIFADSDLAKHILKVSHRISMDERRSIESAKEKWRIELAPSVICHVPMQNLPQVQRHWDDSLFLAFALSDRDRQVVKINSVKLNVQGFIDADARINESANQSVDSMLVSAIGFERQNLVNIRIVKNSQLLFLFSEFGQLEGLSI